MECFLFFVLYKLVAEGEKEKCWLGVERRAREGTKQEAEKREISFVISVKTVLLNKTHVFE